MTEILRNLKIQETELRTALDGWESGADFQSLKTYTENIDARGASAEVLFTLVQDAILDLKGEVHDFMANKMVLRPNTTDEEFFTREASVRLMKLLEPVLDKEVKINNGKKISLKSLNLPSFAILNLKRVIRLVGVQYNISPVGPREIELNYFYISNHSLVKKTGESFSNQTNDELRQQLNGNYYKDAELSDDEFGYLKASFSPAAVNWLRDKDTLKTRWQDFFDYESAHSRTVNTLPVEALKTELDQALKQETLDISKLTEAKARQLIDVLNQISEIDRSAEFRAFIQENIQHLWFPADNPKFTIHNLLEIKKGGLSSPQGFEDGVLEARGFLERKITEIEDIYLETPGDAFQIKLVDRLKEFSNGILQELKSIPVTEASTAPATPSRRMDSNIAEEQRGIGDWVKIYNEWSKDELLAERKLVMKLIGTSRSRLKKGDSEKPMYKRVRALETVMQESGDNELRYQATLLEKWRLVFDMDVDYSITRAMAGNTDGLAGEAGTMHFTMAEVTDWFLSEWMTEEQVANPTDLNQVPSGNEIRLRGPDEGYRFQVETLEAVLFTELVIFTFFPGGSFVEENTTPPQIRKYVSALLAEKFPHLAADDDQLNEITDLGVMLYCLSGGRFNDYTKFLEKGDSPTGHVSGVLESLIMKQAPVTMENYRGYKLEPHHVAIVFDFHQWLHDEIENVKANVEKKFGLRDAAGDFILDAKGEVQISEEGKIKLEDSMSKLHNIEHMIHGIELLQETMAPLRHRRPIPLRDNGRNMIRSPYPTGGELMWERRKERLKKGVTFESLAQIRPNFQKFWTTLFGEIKRGDKFDHRKRGGGPGEHGRANYRRELVEDLHKLFVSAISGLKGNMMVDWDQVADATVTYIDRMFLAYQKFEGHPSNDGLKILYKLMLEHIHENWGNLGSAGPVEWYQPEAGFKGSYPLLWLFGARFPKQVEVIGPDGKIQLRDTVKPGEKVTFRSYLLLRIHPNREKNRKRFFWANIAGNWDHPEGDWAQGMFNRFIPKYNIFKRNQPTFHEATYMLGRSTEKQTHVPKDK